MSKVELALACDARSSELPVEPFLGNRQWYNSFCWQYMDYPTSKVRECVEPNWARSGFADMLWCDLCFLGANCFRYQVQVTMVIPILNNPK